MFYQVFVKMNETDQYYDTPIVRSNGVLHISFINNEPGTMFTEQELHEVVMFALSKRYKIKVQRAES